MFSLMVLLFTVLPAVEIFLLFKIGGEIGALNTFMVVIITGFLGAYFAKSEGLAILSKLQEKVNRGEAPTDQIIQGLMVFAGGLLLLTPGFMTDFFGFSLVMPGPRHILLVFVKKLVEKAIANGNINFSNINVQSGGFHYSKGFGSSHDQSQDNMHIGDEVEPGVFEAEFKEK